MTKMCKLHIRIVSLLIEVGDRQVLVGFSFTAYLYVMCMGILLVCVLCTACVSGVLGGRI